MRKMKVACFLLLVLVTTNYANLFSTEKKFSDEKNQASSIAVWTLPKALDGEFSEVSKIGEEFKTPLFMNSAEFISEARQLEFALPSGMKLVGIRRDEISSDSSWQGELYAFDNQSIDTRGVLRGNVILSFHQNFISGVLYDSDAVYEIQPVGRKHYLIKYSSTEDDKCRVTIDPAEETATSDHSSEIVDQLVSRSDSQKSVLDNSLVKTTAFDQPSNSAQDSGDRVDLMVVYTGAVTANFGGASQTDAFVQTAVSTTNLVFANSQNRVRINTVQSMQIDYAETGNSSIDLNWLKSSFQVNQLRNSSSADIVVLLTNSGDACGVSQLLTGSGTASGSGFSVVKKSCAVGGTAFAHEIGHLFGADHDPLDSPIPPSMHVLPFAYGKAVNGQFVTLMGFFSNSICPEYCPRLLMFSNPGISFNGTPTGIAGQRDNAKVVEYTADLVANLRTSSQTITLDSPNNNVIWRRNMPRDVKWNSYGLNGNVEIQFSRDGGLTFQTITSNTPNDGVETVTLMGMTTRRARIRVVSMDDRRVTDTSLNNFSLL